MKVSRFLGFLLAGLLMSSFIVGCDDDDEEEETGTVTNSVASSGGATQSTSDMETVSDPVENSFTIQAPKGWFNKAYSVRVYDVYRQVVTCVSPNSDTVLFFGDPSIPQYWKPESATDVTRMMAKANPMQKIEDYQPASSYFENYAQRKFGKLKDFHIEKVDVKNEAVEKLAQKFAERNIQFGSAEIVELFFTYDDKGKKMSGMLNGSTVDFGGFWIALVGGVSTTGKAEDYRSMLEGIGASLKISPEWTARQNAKHEQVMEQIRQNTARMTARHNANMQWIQDSAQRHQQRMQSIWAAGDASMKAYYQRSAASDLQHQNFLNYINDETTVVNSSGQTMQVDNSYQRYYVNKNDPSKYVGGDIRLDHDKLGSLGVNPNDYEEVKVRQ